MPAERIQPPGLNNPPPYSHVVKAGDTVYNPGQVAQDEQGQLVGRGDIAAQATQVFENPAPIMAGRLRIGASDLPKGIAEYESHMGIPARESVKPRSPQWKRGSTVFS